MKDLNLTTYIVFKNLNLSTFYSNAYRVDEGFKLNKWNIRPLNPALPFTDSLHFISH